jgi:hypothetical protein
MMKLTIMITAAGECDRAALAGTLRSRAGVGTA